MLVSTRIGNIDEKGIKFDARGRIYIPAVLGGEYPTLSLVCYLSSHWELWRLTPLLPEHGWYFPTAKHRRFHAQARKTFTRVNPHENCGPL
jgi:hypothetical protein